MKRLQVNPAVALLGARQVGKSTLAEMVMEHFPDANRGGDILLVYGMSGMHSTGMLESREQTHATVAIHQASNHDRKQQMAVLTGT